MKQIGWILLILATQYCTAQNIKSLNVGSFLYDGINNNYDTDYPAEINKACIDVLKLRVLNNVAYVEREQQKHQMQTDLFYALRAFGKASDSSSLIILNLIADWKYDSQKEGYFFLLSDGRRVSFDYLIHFINLSSSKNMLVVLFTISEMNLSSSSIFKQYGSVNPGKNLLLMNGGNAAKLNDIIQDWIEVIENFELVSTNDKNGNGVISFTEFTAFLFRQLQEKDFPVKLYNASISQDLDINLVR